MSNIARVFNAHPIMETWDGPAMLMGFEVRRNEDLRPNELQVFERTEQYHPYTGFYERLDLVGTKDFTYVCN